MIYWLFKRYMKRLISEYKAAFEVQFKATEDHNMRPDFFWLERFLNDEMEWEETEDGDFVRRGK